MMWLPRQQLPACIARLKASKSQVPLLVDEDVPGNASKGTNAVVSSVATFEGRSVRASAALEGRKEKSIRELSIKFVSLFLQVCSHHYEYILSGLVEYVLLQSVQAAEHRACDSTISLDQAARSLLKSESGLGGTEPVSILSLRRTRTLRRTRNTMINSICLLIYIVCVRFQDPGAMKTKVRRLYDICNVLSSLKMITKVRLTTTSKPAFKWFGVTEETATVFDSQAAKYREVKAYGGGANLPFCSKRSRVVKPSVNCPGSHASFLTRDWFAFAHPVAGRCGAQSCACAQAH